jgi:hypothetical protein
MILTKKGEKEKRKNDKNKKK